MTACPVHGGQCVCQPDDGVLCPDSSRALRRIADVWDEQSKMYQAALAAKDAEIERLTKERDEASKHRAQFLAMYEAENADCDALHDQLEAKEREIAALRADAERWRYLHKMGTSGVSSSMEPLIYVGMSHRAADNWPPMQEGDALDAAIDAAMKGE